MRYAESGLEAFAQGWREGIAAGEHGVDGFEIFG